ncbi:MAG: hypothetical protein GF384_05285, partial [Elusimicrobia bacterium]|nr:hypothetical protein [Elusimicrobiota bacterium]MBD3412202.1 hypothetical protein [Elusimicrobiota bacterium]
ALCRSSACFNKSMNVIQFSPQCSKTNTHPPMLFFSTSLPVKECGTDKCVVLGSYNTCENPAALLGGTSIRTPATMGKPSVAVFRHDIILNRNKEKQMVVMLGAGENSSEIKKIIHRYQSFAKATKALTLVHKHYDAVMDNTTMIKTPDDDFNALFNTWIKYQVITGSRCIDNPAFASHDGCARGYRHLAVHTQTLAMIDPTWSAHALEKMASLIRKDGSTAPGWTENGRPSTARPYMDDPLWLTPAVYAYICETGMSEILHAEFPYLTDQYINGWQIDRMFKGEAESVSQGSLYDHLWKNLDFCFRNVDVCGLPRIGSGDIMDSIDAAGTGYKGGSVWLAQGLIWSIRLLARLSDLINEREKASELRKRAFSLTERVNQYWDHEWYARGVTDGGMVFGNRKNKQGKIFLDAQVYALLTGIAQKERIIKILRSIDKWLNSPFGYKACAPAFLSPDRSLGTITYELPGVGNNGGVLTSTNVMMIIAHCLMGNGNDAFKTLRAILPGSDADMAHYKAAPYLCPDSIIGPDHAHAHGEACVSWITDAAPMLMNAVTGWMIGVRPELNGLVIDPCLPSVWKKVDCIRFFRGTRYDIVIENPSGIEKGIKEILVNDQKLHGNLITHHASDKRVNVVVRMGSVKKDQSKKPSRLVAV